MSGKNQEYSGLLAATLILSGIATGCAQQSEDYVSESLTPVEQTLRRAPRCKRPVEAVVRTLNCIEKEDAACTAAGYAPDFVKLHNTVNTNTVVTRPDFWPGVFFLLDIGLDIDHVVQVAPNEVSIRYVETVSTIAGQSFLQHEHALVTVDGNCRMTLWDQYGDNAEQKAVDDAVAAIIASLPTGQ